MVTLGRSLAKRDLPDHPTRLVIVKIKPHISQGKYKGGTSGVDRDGFLRIATNLLDVPAEISALLYEYRWTIEIFFRQFQHLLGCRHLLSHHQNGITIQTYCAIIACLLIALWTGRKPTKRTQEMLCYFLTGWASAEEVAAHVAKLKEADEKTENQLTAARARSHVTIRAPSRCALQASFPTCDQCHRPLASPT